MDRGARRAAVRGAAESDVAAVSGHSTAEAFAHILILSNRG